jgi:glycosyltransferase involved in cell wall biosynthesis
VLIEVMDAGKPIVTSRIAPMTEIVQDAQTGLLVQVDDPAAFAAGIASLLQQPGLGREMGRCGQQRVREHFTATRMAADTLGLYRTLLARNR